ncbi:NFACT family protein [Ornithinibacillus massiliensis]|uniref:Rqc2 homolog RqcH n=1 Tax=Ornithinibacillus massiliensis TaxID=1944633 RepID=A0ABS5MCQ6_9BACI|nr:NFACT RNA binding domain-containing protein [Ornithinibacillus massiliensis]MBS3680109.1 NFACT family protein [Ornithinibacillus massiliensis]
MPFDGIVTRAVTKELSDTLVPGKITKIYQPTDTEIIMTIRSQGKNHVLLLSIHPTYSRVHLTKDSFHNPADAPMFCMVLRKHLSGAILEAIEQDGMERIVTFSIKTRNEIGDISYKKLVIELMGKHSNLMLVDNEKGHIIDSLKHITMAQNRYRTVLPGSVYVLPPQQDKLNPLEVDGETFIRKLDFNAGKLDSQIVRLFVGFSPFIAKELLNRASLGTNEKFMEEFLKLQEQIADNRYQPVIYRGSKEEFHVIEMNDFQGDKEYFSTTNQMLDTFYSGKAERDRVKQQAKDLYRFIQNERDKNERKLKKHARTLKKAESADKYQKLGELLTANMHVVKQGDTSVTVIDYYDPEQAEVTIDLNPNKTPSENAQGYFKTYQKLKTSKVKVEEEMVKTKEEISYFDQLLQQIDVAGVEDIEEIREELREEGYLKKQKIGKRKNKQTTPKPEEYIASDGTTILVGKNNKQNEYLTMKLAHRDEIWLHTKDIPGSHVVIRAKEPSDETITEAAQLAAYYSKSQNSSSVPVDFTKVRHVKKPNGSKPGFVIYDNQRTIYVTPDKSVVDKLKK